MLHTIRKRGCCYFRGGGVSVIVYLLIFSESYVWPWSGWDEEEATGSPEPTDRDRREIQTETGTINTAADKRYEEKIELKTLFGQCHASSLLNESTTSVSQERKIALECWDIFADWFSNFHFKFSHVPKTSDVGPDPVGSRFIWVRVSGSRGIKSLIKWSEKQSLTMKPFFRRKLYFSSLNLKKVCADVCWRPPPHSTHTFFLLL